MFIENKIKKYEKDICTILAHLAFHIHPDIVRVIQEQNENEYSYFKECFGDRINVDDYLFPSSACVFPGVRRYVSGQGKKNAYNLGYSAIIDDNTFPRHLWCFLENGKTYNSLNWQNPGLGEFELAHVFAHKETEMEFEKKFFTTTSETLTPYGNFSCACNVVLLPKGTVRPTDKSEAIKAAFYMRYIELYGEAPLNGRAGFKQSLVPDWYSEIVWNEPPLPNNWEKNVDKLLEYRTQRVIKILSK